MSTGGSRVELPERERKFDVVALFYTLLLGFAAGSDRTIQAFLERYIEMADCDESSYCRCSWLSNATRISSSCT